MSFRRSTLFVKLSEIESQYKCSMVFVQLSKILSKNKCTMHGLIGYKKESGDANNIKECSSNFRSV
jgi:hypothetical protein